MQLILTMLTMFTLTMFTPEEKVINIEPEMTMFSESHITDNDYDNNIPGDYVIKVNSSSEALYWQMAIKMKQHGLTWGLRPMTFAEFNQKDVVMTIREYELIVKPKYRDEPWLVDEVNKHVSNTMNGLIGNDDIETITNVHDYVCSLGNYDYVSAMDTEVPWAKDGAFDLIYTGEGICSSYAMTFQAYMDAFGIQSRICVGPTEAGWHCWNIVLVDGEWKKVDCTWDDDINDNISHEWLLVPNS